MFRAISSALSFFLMLLVVKIVLPEALDLLAELVINLLQFANQVVENLETNISF